MKCYCNGSCTRTGRCESTFYYGGGTIVPSPPHPVVPIFPLRIKSVEYNPDGTIKKVEYFE